MTLGRQTCGSWDSAIGHEWLVTNGLGGYACGTVAGANTRRYHAFLAPVAQHLNAACVGSVSEIFDGDAPHSARGCFAQAWSVAEILRSWIYLERKISKS